MKRPRRRPATLAGLLLAGVSVLLMAGSLSPAAKPSAASAAVGARDDRFALADGTVAVHVPAGPTTTGVLVLHSLGNGSEEPVRQGWSTLADREGFVGIYPERGTSWNAGLCCGAAAATARDDVSWLAEVIAAARQRYHLSRVYLAGFSNGGMMAERLVAERPQLSDRFAVWGAAPEMPRPGAWRGRGTAYTGELDIIVPARGGVLVIGDRPTQVRPAARTGTYLPGARVDLVRVPGRGHAVPPDWPQLAWRALTGPGG